MKLKLDLHPIYSDGGQIESALQAIIDEACEKRASEIEIIPGKGSGALKKTVLRYLDRREVKARYHRIEKDSDNWGRLFVHFRWDRSVAEKSTGSTDGWISVDCFCCQGSIMVDYDPDGVDQPISVRAICPGCGSPNKVSLRRSRGRGPVSASATSGYE